MLYKTLQPFFRIFLCESIKGNSHPDTGMRADGFSSHVNLFVIGFDGQRYNLPNGKRRESEYITATDGDVTHGAPIAGIAYFRMDAHTGIAYKAGEPAPFFIFSCHTTNSLHTQTLVAV